MLEALATVFKAIADSLFYLFREAWRQMGVIGGSLWSWATLLCSGIIWAADLVTTGIIKLADFADALIMQSFPSIPSGASLSNLYAVGNTIFPLTEAAGMLVLYVVVIGLCTAYRLVKSWIPTLS